MTRLFSTATATLMAISSCIILAGNAMAALPSIETFKDKKTNRVVLVTVPPKNATMDSSASSSATRVFAISTATSFFKSHGRTFGLKNVSKELFPVREEVDSLGMSHVRFVQRYKGIPVVGAEAIAHISGNQVNSVSAKVVPSFRVSTRAAVTSDQAISYAINKWSEQFPGALAPVVGSVKLRILSPGLLLDSKDKSVYLVWEVKLFSEETALDEAFYIDAKTGELLYQLTGTKNSKRSLSISNLRIHYPDRYNSPNLYCGSSAVLAVLINSAVPNNAAHLLTDGGFFNGCTIGAIGLVKTMKIWLRAITHYYTRSETFNGSYAKLIQACGDLYKATSNTCIQVKRALQAVEMDQGGRCSGIPATTPLCVDRPIECVDSDASSPLPQNQKGTVTYRGKTYIDACFALGKKVQEYSCVNDAQTLTMVSCPNGCVNGACK